MRQQRRSSPGGSYARALRGAVIGAVALVMVAVVIIGLEATRPAPSTGPAAALDPQDAALVARGRVVYAESCAVCHGATLEGHPGWQPGTSGGLAPPLGRGSPAAGKADEALIATTRNGAVGMPSFAGTLSEDGIRAALSYIRAQQR